MKIYLMNRDYHLVRNQHIITAITYFIRGISWFAITLPYLALGVWAAGLITRAVRSGGKATAGITVALVGMALIFFILYFFRVKWNNYKFDIRSGIYLVLTFLFLTAYQFVAILMSDNVTVFGLSAIFLSANGLIMMIIVFIQSAVKDGSIDDLIKARIPAADLSIPPKDITRQEDFNEEINKEREDKAYFPNTNDFYDVFTIGKPQFITKTESTAFSSGLQNYFGSLNPNIKRIITVGLWILATGILVVYSIVVKNKSASSENLGFLIMIALLTTDVLVYLIQHAEIV
jgi:hypothetical protein